MTDKRELPLEVTIRGGKTQGLLGMTFLAAPLALLALRYRHGRRLLAAGLMLGVLYFANIGTRFLIPPLPFVCLAMALAIGSGTGSGPPLLAALMMFHAASSWPAEMHRYSDKFVWGLNHVMFNQALRLIPQEKFLRESDRDYGAARLVEATVPEGERRSWFARSALRLLQPGNPVDLSVRTEPDADRLDQCKHHRRLSAYGSGIVQIPGAVRPAASGCFRQPRRATPNAQWSVHELRFFASGNGATPEARMAPASLAQSVGGATGFRQFAGHAMANLGDRQAGRLHGRGLRTGQDSG